MFKKYTLLVITLLCVAGCSNQENQSLVSSVAKLSVEDLKSSTEEMKEMESKGRDEVRGYKDMGCITQEQFDRVIKVHDMKYYVKGLLLSDLGFESIVAKNLQTEFSEKELAALNDALVNKSDPGSELGSRYVKTLNKSMADPEAMRIMSKNIDEARGKMERENPVSAAKFFEPKLEHIDLGAVKDCVKKHKAE